VCSAPQSLHLGRLAGHDRATASDDGGADSLTPRGYTGHEMLDDLGLVHMNGRIYDPLLGRFLSADPVVQFPGSLQSYNRYSYVMNNPLTLTDPTGYECMLDRLATSIAASYSISALERLNNNSVDNKKVEVDKNKPANTKSNDKTPAATTTQADINDSKPEFKELDLAQIAAEAAKLNADMADLVKEYTPGSDSDSNSDGYGAGGYGASPTIGNKLFQNNTKSDCSIAMFQCVEKLEGKNVRSRADLIKLTGLPAEQFNTSDVTGGFPSDRNQATLLLNKVLANDHLQAIEVHTKDTTEFADLVKGGDILILGSTIAWLDPVEGLVRRHHIVAAHGVGKNNQKIEIFNRQGRGGSDKFTPQETMQRDMPANLNGDSQCIWIVKPTP